VGFGAFQQQVFFIDSRSLRFYESSGFFEGKIDSLINFKSKNNNLKSEIAVIAAKIGIDNQGRTPAKTKPAFWGFHNK
jgi:hypothetical protein